MHRLLLLAMLVIVGAVSAQDTSTENQTSPAEAPEALIDEELSDEELSSQDDHTEDDEDVFKPTDVVSYSQSVPFPVDI